MTDSQSELKPCPLCGAEALVDATLKKEFFWLACSGCGLETTTYGTKAEAITAWNTRAQPGIQSDDALVEELALIRDWYTPGGKTPAKRCPSIHTTLARAIARIEALHAREAAAKADANTAIDHYASAATLLHKQLAAAKDTLDDALTEIKRLEHELAAAKADAEMLAEVVEAMANFDGRNNNTALKQMARQALATYREKQAKGEVK